MRSLDIKGYNIYKYIIISIYIFNKDRSKVVLIYYKIYIIDNLSIKIFINIDIIKLKDIILNINKNLIIIKSYNLL